MEKKTENQEKTAASEVVKEAFEVAKEVEEVVEKKGVKPAKKFWRMLGPGLTTGAADDDPSGITTYSQAGAQYGFGLLWLSLFTFPLMAVVQEMCARIGLVTGRGLAANIRIHYPRGVLFLCTALLFFANTFNLGADLGAMAEATRLLFPRVPLWALVTVFAVMSLLLQIFTTYERYARYLKWLALFLMSYVFSAIAIRPDFRILLFHTLVPSLSLSKEQIILVCAVLGTTISPYLFFWQTSQETEEEILKGKTTLKEREGSNPHEIHTMRIDVWVGMFISNLVMFFIIAASGGTLFVHGIHTIETAPQAASAIRPFAGDLAYLLFALGIIGTGMLAVPVLAGSASYAIAESFRWKEGLYRKLHDATAFYGVIILSVVLGLFLNFIGLDPMRALIISAIINGVIAPVILIPIVQLSSNKQIMGTFINNSPTTLVGWLTVGVMIIAGIATLVSFLW